MSDELTDPKREELAQFAQMVMDRAKESHANALERTHPEKAAAILWHRSIGDSYKKIRNKYGVGLATIKRMEIEYKDPLAAKRKDMTINWLVIADSAQSALMTKFEQYEDNPELLADVSPDRLSLTAAMAQDKAMVLEGHASTIVEHKSGKSIEDAQETLRVVRARVAERNKIIDVEAEDV